MKTQLFKFLTLAKVEVVAPVSGGSVGIFTWAVKMAPVISIAAAIIGIVIGVWSFLLKRKQANLQMELTRAQLKQINNESSLSKS